MHPFFFSFFFVVDFHFNSLKGELKHKKKEKLVRLHSSSQKMVRRCTDPF